MKTIKTPRGFIRIAHPIYTAKEGTEGILIQESSAVGDYEDAISNPGSSYLWVDGDYHLNREEVKELIDHLQYWLDNKRLKYNEEN